MKNNMADTKQLEDDDVMKYGKYQARKMKDIPAIHLVWIFENYKEKSGPVYEYVARNIDAIRERRERDK